MTPAEASALVVRLQAAFPTTKLDAETIRLYLEKLRPLNAELGAKAVDSALEGAKRFPPIGELFEHYGIVREQAARDRKEKLRQEENAAFDGFERVPLKDIPTVTEHLAKLRGAEPEELVHLEEVSEGKCDDCPAEGKRFAFHGLALCSRCVSSRLRVKSEIEAA